MQNPSFIIIGAGAGGMGMAIKLKEAGYDNITILERAAGIGGTWYYNRYPGCECDIPSHLYSYSFELNPGWTKPYATQPEILAYLERVAEKYAIHPLCQFNTEVSAAEWDAGSSQWRVQATNGTEYTANFLISAIGMFSEISYPAIDGLDSFAGTSFHSARWDYDHSLEGKRVAVIGSAASAIQFLPKIVEQAGHIGQQHLKLPALLLFINNIPVSERVPSVVFGPEKPRAHHRGKIEIGLSAPLFLP